MLSNILHFKNLKSLLLAMLALPMLGFLGGCAQAPKDPAMEKAGNPKVSSIPWNRPQGWESGAGAGGGMGAFSDPRYR